VYTHTGQITPIIYVWDYMTGTAGPSIPARGWGNDWVGWVRAVLVEDSRQGEATVTRAHTCLTIF
jgi:hypothetical protein